MGPDVARTDINLVEGMYYLYVKTHQVTGLKYLGQTKQDPFKYKGSGTYWKLHIKKHGDHVSTEILKECETQEDLIQWSEYYSDLWSVGSSDSWANLMPENGKGGWPPNARLGKTHSAETRAKMSASKKGISINRVAPVSDETKAKLSKSQKGRKRSAEAIQKQLETKIKNGTLKHSEETKAKLSKPISEETRAKRIANHTRPTKDHFWANNGTEQALVQKLPEGWSKGRLIKPTAPSQKGRFWATDGVQNKMVFELPEGWSRGRTRSASLIQ